MCAILLIKYNCLREGYRYINKYFSKWGICQNCLCVRQKEQGLASRRRGRFIEKSEKPVLAKRDTATWGFLGTSRNWLRVRSRNIRVHLAINVSCANVETWTRLQAIPLIEHRAPVCHRTMPIIKRLINRSVWIWRNLWYITFTA